MANTYTVLVVDDEPQIRRFLCTSLTAAGTGWLAPMTPSARSPDWPAKGRM